jgi:S1-C subfamily serine protease
MKTLIAAAMLCLAVWPAWGQSNTDFTSKHEQMLYTVVLVQISGAAGSGTVIWSNTHDGEVHSYILTNYHVVESSVKITKQWSPQKQKEVDVERRDIFDVFWFDYNDFSRNVGKRGKRARVVAYDKLRDLALVRLLDTESLITPVVYMQPDEGTLHLFDTVWAIGAGLGNPPFTTSGNLAFLDKQIDGYRYMLSTAPIIFGNSGGALFHWSLDRKRYELIGVPSKVSAAGFFTPVSHMAWAIPMSTVYEFLRANDFCFITGDPQEECDKLKPKDDSDD